MIRPIALTFAILFALGTSAARPSAAAGLSGVDTDEIETSYTLLTSEFYKQVDAQKVLDSTRSSLLVLLKKDGVVSPVLPVPRATVDRTQNIRQIERLVSLAVSEAGSKAVPRDITYGAISGMLSSVNDRYTVFLTPKEYADLNQGLDPSFGGVGIVMKLDEQTKQLRINEVLEGGPADKAGLKSGDTIVTIDGTPTKGASMDDDAKMLRGKEGTVVRLQIERSGASLASAVSVTRAIIHPPSVTARIINNNIGYARLSVFGPNAGDELSRALTRLDSQGAKAYILDLRDNGGGYLDAAINVSSKFVPSGPIVSVESRGGSETEYDAENTAIPPHPLAVLVNKYTASASEITSGAIQDSGVGELVGERTFGKGVVQTIHPMPDGSAVKITTARYLTPRGRDINSIGITPDIVVPTPKNGTFGELPSDTQLQSAVDYLQRKLASDINARQTSASDGGTAKSGTPSTR